MRTALLAASLALVAGTTVGCGGGDGGGDGGGGAPTDASVSDFCGTFEDFQTEAAELGADPDPAEIVTVLKRIAEGLEEIGTPEGIPDDARQGFELIITTIQNLPEDATEKDIQELDKDFTAEQEKQSDAFDEYLTDTCEEPSETPSE